MKDAVIQQIVIAVLSMALGMAIHYLFTIKKKVANRFFEINAFRREVKSILEKARMDIKCLNVVLTHAHNGGEVLHANTFLYSSVIEESPYSNANSFAKQHQKIMADYAYKDMLEDVERDGFCLNDIPTLKESFIKYTGLRCGFKGSIAIKVYDKTKASFIYVEFFTDKDVRDFRFSKEYSYMLATAAHLAELCKTYHKKGILK